MRLDRRRLTRLVAVLVAVASLAGGCGGRASETAAGSAPALESVSPSTVGSTSPSTVGSTRGPSISVNPSRYPRAVEVTETDRGSVVTVAVGTTISVVLHSTYWSAPASSNQRIVGAAGPATVTPASPGTCLPGIGCGTVTSIFVARTIGDAVLTAGRTVCGEALNCSGADKSWNVVIQVRG